MTENKSFFKKQTTRVKKAGQDIVEDSKKDSIISIAIAVISFVITVFKALGEYFGNWLSEIDDKNKRGDK